MAVVRRRAALAGGAVLIAVLTVALLAQRGDPDLDNRLWQDVAPVVHAALPAADGVTWPVPAGERWFCAERPVETSRVGDQVRVGLVARCGAFGRRGGALMAGGGLSGALVVLLAPGPDGYRVLDVEAPADGAGHDASLRRMFSAAGYADVRESADVPGPDPAPEARAAFGLPADAPVVSR